MFQGLLDYKYIQDRFEKGKQVCKTLLDDLQKTVCCGSLQLGHPTIVASQAEMGPDTFLSCSLMRQFGMNKGCHSCHLLGLSG